MPFTLKTCLSAPICDGLKLNLLLVITRNQGLKQQKPEHRSYSTLLLFLSLLSLTSSCCNSLWIPKYLHNARHSDCRVQIFHLEQASQNGTTDDSQRAADLLSCKQKKCKRSTFQTCCSYIPIILRPWVPLSTHNRPSVSERSAGQPHECVSGLRTLSSGKWAAGR